MGNSLDWQNLSVWELAQATKTKLSALLVDPETQMFHSWLFDTLNDLDVYKKAAKEIRNNLHTEDAVLDKLVRHCHKAACPCISPETREARKSVLRVLFQNLDVHWLASLLDLKDHKKNHPLVKRFKEEMRKRRREERRQMRKMPLGAPKNTPTSSLEAEVEDDGEGDVAEDDVSISDSFYERAAANFST